MRGTAGPRCAAAQALRAVDDAQHAALRALTHLEAGEHPPLARSAGPSPAPAAPPGVEPGAAVLLRDVRILDALCAASGCPATPDLRRWAGGSRNGVVQSLAEGGLAAVSFGDGRVVAVPAAALVAAPASPRRSPGAVSPVQAHGPPSPGPGCYAAAMRPLDRAAADRRMAQQLTRSLRLRAQQLRRKDTELQQTKEEVAILRRQLDKLGAAQAARTLLLREASVLSMPPLLLPVQRGVEIAHWSEHAAPLESLTAYGALRALPGEMPGRRRRVPPPPAAGEECPIGADGSVSVLVGPPPDGGGGLLVTAHNATEDSQIDLTLKVCGSAPVQRWEQGGRGRALWDAAAPRSFRLRLFPGETVPAVLLLGEWSEWSASYSFAPVTDSAFLTELAAMRQGAVDAAQADQAAACREFAHGVDPTSRRPTEARRVARACVRAGVTFVDPSFPPCSSSLCPPGQPWVHPGARPEGWMRAHELLAHSGMVHLGEFTPTAADPGRLGSAALCSAAAALSESSGARLFGLFDTAAMQPPQTAEETAADHASGAWRVKLCPGGWWESFTIDDWLPALNAAARVPAGMRPRLGADGAALWPGLLEKAVAKARGSYAAAARGPLDWHLHALTGEHCVLLRWADEAFADLARHLSEGDTVLLATPPPAPGGTGGEAETRRAAAYTAAGLAMGLGYRVLAAEAVQGVARLVRIRNPWAHATQWRGPWGHCSEHWEQSLEARQMCNIPSPAEAGTDGTFWMDWSDVLGYFSGGCVCTGSSEWRGHSRAAAGSCWDLRFKVGFRAGRPLHAVELRCHVDCVVRASAAQQALPDGSLAALRLDVLEHSAGDGCWERVVDSGTEYVRGLTVGCAACHLHAGGRYAVVVTQWPREANEAFRNSSSTAAEGGVVLRLCCSEQGFGALRVCELSREVADTLRYDGYPGFDIDGLREVAIPAQADGQCLPSSEVMPAPLHAPAGLAALRADSPGTDSGSSVWSDSDTDADQEDLPNFASLDRRRGDPELDGARVDPELAAGRIRMHLRAGGRDPIGAIHPVDRRLLEALTDAMERGRPAVAHLLERLYEK